MKVGGREATYEAHRVSLQIPDADADGTDEESLPRRPKTLSICEAQESFYVVEEVSVQCWSEMQVHAPNQKARQPVVVE